jgi:adenosine deaminase
VSEAKPSGHRGRDARGPGQERRPEGGKGYPLAELHVHLEGTAPPELIRRIARRNNLALPPGTIGVDGRYEWDDFLHFLRVYDQAASVIRSAQDYRDITFEYLSSCAGEGAIYVELTASPDHAALAGLSYPDQIGGIAQGIDDARDATGIEARILITAVRNFGTDRAEAVAALPAADPHPYVTGFGLAGDEAGFPPEPFARAYEIAHDAGLGLAVHAGEWAGPESVRGGMELPVTRIGHGVRAIEEPELVAEIAARGLVLEVCPTSNVALGLYPDYASHPFPALRDAGVKVTLGSDDPPYWAASIGGEYAVADREFGLSDEDLRDITRTAIEAAFVDTTLRQQLLTKVESR